MSKFVKKPVIIEAVPVSVILLGKQDLTKDAWTLDPAITLKEDYLEIKTLEGTMRADLEDWVIKGIQGELYPCKPSIFEDTYDLITYESILVIDLIQKGLPSDDWEDISVYPDFVTATIGGERVLVEAWQHLTRNSLGNYSLEHETGS